MFRQTPVKPEPTDPGQTTYNTQTLPRLSQRQQLQISCIKLEAEAEVAAEERIAVSRIRSAREKAQLKIDLMMQKTEATISAGGAATLALAPSAPKEDDLAELQLGEPPFDYLSSESGSIIAKRLCWYGLPADVRKEYTTAVDSYEVFCSETDLDAWPASIESLEDWIANRIHGSPLLKQGRIKPDIIITYLAALRSHHVHHNFPLQVFENPKLALIIRGGIRMLHQTESGLLPTTSGILRKIRGYPSMAVDDFSI